MAHSMTHNPLLALSILMCKLPKFGHEASFASGFSSFGNTPIKYFEYFLMF